MKITKKQLKHIIQEEKARILNEQMGRSEEGTILGRLEDAASLFEAYADRYGSNEWDEEGFQGDSEEKRILDKITGLRNHLESYFDQYGPQAFG